MWKEDLRKYKRKEENKLQDFSKNLYIIVVGEMSVREWEDVYCNKDMPTLTGVFQLDPACSEYAFCASWVESSSLVSF